jgi:hypothetical protein
VFQGIFLILGIILFLAFFIFLSDKFWDLLIYFINNSIQKRIDTGNIDDDKLTKLCQIYAKPSLSFALITGGLFYKKVLKMQKSIYYIYRREVKKRNLFI